MGSGPGSSTWQRLPPLPSTWGQQQQQEQQQQQLEGSSSGGGGGGSADAVPPPSAIAAAQVAELEQLGRGLALSGVVGVGCMLPSSCVLWL